MKIIALGPKGSYGHEAAQIARRGMELGDETPICFVSTNVGILQAAESEAEFAIIPVENSTYGDVVDVLGYLARQSIKYPLRIIGQVELPVRHCLMVRSENSIADLEVIMSHPQAIGQCSESIKRWGLKTEVSTSTAAAAKFVAENPDIKIGAIASELAASEYGLKVLERNVQTFEDNTTRFFVFGRPRRKLPTGNDKTVVIFRIPNQSGALIEALIPFASRNINMASIHSIALGGWSYGFYVEIDGHERDPQVHEALHELVEKTTEQWVLGSFPKEMRPDTILF